MRVHVNGTELFVETHGQGRPLLLMHGGLGWDHSYLRPWLDPLGEVAELIYYDHRGNGRSAPVADWSSVTHETWVEDAEALREALGHERILLFGHSYGGYLAQEYALHYPERLEGLILCSTAPAMDYPEVAFANAQARSTPEVFQAIAEGFSRPVADDARMAELSLAVLPLYFHLYDPEIGARLHARTEFRAAAYNRAFLECLPTFSVIEDLPRLDVPCLILAGADDWLMPPTQGAERIHRLLPRSELIVFERSGHFPFVEEQEAFLARVSAWVEGLG